MLNLIIKLKRWWESRNIIINSPAMMFTSIVQKEGEGKRYLRIFKDATERLTDIRTYQQSDYGKLALQLDTLQAFRLTRTACLPNWAYSPEDDPKV